VTVDDEFIAVADRGQVCFAPIVAVDSEIISYLADVARPISFSDQQFEQVCLAAAACDRLLRDQFLRDLARRLPSVPTDQDLTTALAAMAQASCCPSPLIGLKSTRRSRDCFETASLQHGRVLDHQPAVASLCSRPSFIFLTCTKGSRG
jgi:hypothetical protein